MTIAGYGYLYYLYLTPSYDYDPFGRASTSSRSVIKVLLSPELGWIYTARVVLCAVPAIFSLYITRRSRLFLVTWALGLLAWIGDTYASAPFGIDGQNGCEQCDFGSLLTIGVAWLSLPIAGVVWAKTKPAFDLTP